MAPKRKKEQQQVQQNNDQQTKGTVKKTKVPKNRLDVEVVQRGLAAEKIKAAALIMAGDILVNGQVVYKADTPVTPQHQIQLKEKNPYVSRGAEKIAAAFDTFGINLKGLKALDVGISTGGFTDYMLQQGVQQVTGVDVNIQQVDHRLRQDQRVTLVKVNARHLKKSHVPFEPDLITIDVSFISVSLILPALSVFPNARIVSLIKPQFEMKREHVGKGGIVTDEENRLQMLLELKQKIEELNFAVTGFTIAGIKGRKGNREYFFSWSMEKRIQLVIQ